MNLGNQKWQSELLFNFAMALIAGVLLVFAVLVLLYRRFLAPFVNMGSLILAPLGARSLFTSPASPCRCSCSSGS